MGRIILVYDLFLLKLGVIEVYQQRQVDGSDVQIGQPLGHFIFIKRFNTLVRLFQRDA